MSIAMQCRVRVVLSCLCVFSAIFAASAKPNEPSAEQLSVYVPSDNPMHDVQNALDKAKADNKLLLIVMGAQWCHDSTGLVDKFADPELAEVLAASYELSLIHISEPTRPY